MPPTPRPHVLLVEDDASLQRFVALALEDLEIELCVVDTVDAALALLAQRPVALILSDLMLPGRSGLELIDELAARPDLLGPARLAVLSAGLNPGNRRLLERPELWRLLSNPCAAVELEACVREAIAAAPRAAPPATAAAAAEEPPEIAAAIAHHFGGNRALYLAFRAGCLQQFQADMAEGDRACDAADAQALRRLAHSLKSVLLTLGHEPASLLARRLEDRAAGADWDAARPGWAALRAALNDLR